MPIADTGNGGAHGIGTGSGAGRGRGVGDGADTGAGGGDTYARAEWIERPEPAAYRRHWPVGYGKLDDTISVKLLCTLHQGGRPRRCDALRDLPHPEVFGTAAIAIVRGSRIRPVAQDGTLRWDLPVIIMISFDPPIRG